MLITIDTNEQTVEVLNEDTKDWERAYLRSINYNIEANDLTTIHGTVEIPTHIIHTLDFEVALPYGKY